MERLRKAGLGIAMAAMFGSIVASSAFAQSSAAKKAEGEKTEAAASAQKPAPKTKVEGSFGSWTLICGKEGEDEAAKERCSLVLPLVEKESQKLIFRVIVTYGPKGNLVMRVDGPTSIALQRGIEFSPDTKKQYRIPFQTCLPAGCRALLIVADELRKELVASKQGSLTVYGLDGRAFRTVTSLEGFSAGMEALDKKAKVETTKAQQ